MFRKNRLRVAVAAVAVFAAPLLAAPQDVVATRVAGLREIGSSFKNINDD